MSKKGLIGSLIAFFFFLIIVVVFSIFSWGKSSNDDEVKHKTIEKSKKNKKPVPKLTEKEKAEKKEKQKQEYRGYIIQYELNLATLDKEYGTIFDNYQAVLEKEQVTPKELKTRLGKIEDDIYTGFYYKSEGFEKTMEFLNTHNTSAVNTAKEYSNKSTNILLKNRETLRKLNKEYGIDVSF